jgi:hypothetical protein
VNPAWFAAFVALAGLLGGLFIWLVKNAWQGIARFNSFLEDWNGSPGDSRGHTERPGVLQRISRQEALMADVQAQVHMNGGGSLRDEVKRTESAVEQLAGDVSVVKDKVNNLAVAVDVLKARP